MFGLPLLVITGVSLAVILPFIFWGNPSGHDFEFQMNSWMEVLSQWKQGVIYPAWAGLAHYGYGEARFIFYPPISWILGALLGTLLPWPVVPATYIWIALMLSGCGMFLLVRTWLSRGDAIFAATFYAANPYYLVIIYWRSAFAELLAGALLPLLVIFVLRLGKRQKAVLPLALIVAAIWLINIPAAVMATYSLVLVALGLAINRRSPRIARAGIFAISVGAALASFYLLPAIYEQKWISIGRVLTAGFRPPDNFLFTRTGDADHDRFNLLVSLVACSEIGALAVAIFFSRRRRFPQSSLSSLIVWSLWCTVVMFAIASPAWEYLPEFKFVQFPWRWLLCLNLPLAVLVTLAWSRWWRRLLVCSALVFVLVLVWHRVQAPWWDTSADIAELLDDQQTGHGYEGTEEYVPAGADPYEIGQDAPIATSGDATPVQIHIQEWDARSKLLTAQTRVPAKIYLRLFNYPAWKVEINGRAIATETRDVTGQMVVPLQPGMNRVSITFATMWDRKIGMLVSLLTLLISITLLWSQRFGTLN
ncbi:MAG: 6-pyruvoyl-tetrahydropterin synthase-related protein [Terriglobales bacterium]